MSNLFVPHCLTLSQSKHFVFLVSRNCLDNLPNATVMRGFFNDAFKSHLGKLKSLKSINTQREIIGNTKTISLLLIQIFI